MCVNLNNIDTNDLAKLATFVKEMNDGKEMMESKSVLGALLGLTALFLVSGETLHLVDGDVVAELQRRAQINIKRGEDGLPPKLSEDWAKEALAEQMGISVEEVEQYIQQQTQNAMQGGQIVPPGAYQPPSGDQRPTINPVGEQPKDDGDDFRPGMYL